MAQKIVKHVKDMVAEANKEVEITPVVAVSYTHLTLPTSDLV